MNGWPDVTAKQKVFCYKYLVSYDHVLAGKSIDVSPAKALEFLRLPLVGAFIEQLKETQRLRLQIDSDMVKMHWMNILPVLMGNQPAHRTIQGEEVVTRHFDAQAAVSALKELGTIAKITETDDGQGAQPMHFTFEVSPAKKEVKVTNAKPDTDS